MGIAYLAPVVSLLLPGLPPCAVSSELLGFISLAVV